MLPEPLPEQALDDLETLGTGGTWEVFGRPLKVTNLDKLSSTGVPTARDRGASGTSRGLLVPRTVDACSDTSGPGGPCVAEDGVEVCTYSWM